MHFFHKSLIIALALTSGLMAAPFHRITLPKEHVVLHNNQVLIQLDGEWVAAEELHSDGKRLCGPRIRDPLMSRCSRVDIRYDFENSVLDLGFEFDFLKEREKREHRDNQQNSESSNPPEPSHHSERDQDN